MSLGGAVSDRRVAFAAFLLLAGVASGCSAQQPAMPSDAPPVVLPGAPGDQPRVVRSVETRADAGPMAAEISYAGSMIEHHRQAVRMTELAANRAADPRVRALAERIGAAQPAEIGAMQGWLSTHGADGHGAYEQGADGHGNHAAHRGMPGMATPEQLRELADARGAGFDELFLRLMTTHHEGALRMATDLLTTGHDEQLHEMAQDVLATQTDEIATMRRLLDEH